MVVNELKMKAGEEVELVSSAGSDGDSGDGVLVGASDGVKELSANWDMVALEANVSAPVARNAPENDAVRERCNGVEVVGELEGDIAVE